MFVFLSTTALVLGLVTLYSSSVPKLPIWLRIANIIVGLGFTGLGVWSIFMVSDSVKVVFPTPLYVLPILAIIASSLYQWSIISWGLSYAERPVRMKKVREPKAPKPAKVKAVKVKKEKPVKTQKVEEKLDAPVVEAPPVQSAPPVATPLPERPATSAPAKPAPTPKTITTSDGFDLKLPDLF